MVTSERFTGLISVIVGTDLEGVVTFLRSEGVNVSLSAKPTEVTRILVYSLANSEVLKQSFISWADSRYQNTTQSNYSGESYASGFDPMATQGSGQEFDAMSSQQGANLKDGGFANASGEFDTMSTQSGGFSPTETQFANSDGEGGWLSNLFGGNSTPYDATTGTGGTGVGNALRKVNWNDLINNGVGIWQQTEQNKVQRDTINAGIKAKQLELDTALANGEITRQSYEAQLELARLDKNAPQSTVYLWIIGGVVLLGALGTTIYFATRKK
tara:strand:- start:1189 stop:2001 length:813 start_codon:yes stop_codon:yes gene_type:complete